MSNRSSSSNPSNKRSSFADAFFQAGAQHEAVALCFDTDDEVDDEARPSDVAAGNQGGAGENNNTSKQQQSKSKAPVTERANAYDSDEGSIDIIPPSLSVQPRRGGSRRGSTYLGRRATGSTLRDFQESLVLSSTSSFNNSGINNNSTSSMRKLRQSSWYQDALGQGLTEAELKALMGEDESKEIDHTDEHEVLEQYRIMALHEAQRRVNENLGYNVEEAVAARKQEEQTMTEKERASTTMESIPKVPPRTKPPKPTIHRQEAHFLKPPSIPLPVDTERINFFVQQRGPHEEPELQKGVVFEAAGGTKDDGTRIKTRCLGCKSPLSVSQLALLVKCPSCSVVSPATATRR